jgi:multiple sugar transport system substrate-binding protein
MDRRTILAPLGLAALALAAGLAAAPAAAQAPFADVGQQPPITILINSSPWFAGFERVSQLYEQQTPTCSISTSPYGGMLEGAQRGARGHQPL